MFHYQKTDLHCEEKGVKALAKEHGTPLYIYSRAAIENNYLAYSKTLGKRPHLICYAVKANSNLAVIDLLARLGSGFDIVSGGELARCLKAGAEPQKIVFSGVGKTREEITSALKANIHGFNVESENELYQIEEVARELGVSATVSLRVNPNVDAKTHPYIATGLKNHKFGLSEEVAMPLFEYAHKSPHLDLLGIACHIGSQLTEVTPYLDALNILLALYDKLADHDIVLSEINIGGGLGITYTDEKPPAISELCAALDEAMAGRELTIVLEPGRSIVGNAGVLVTKVLNIKPAESKNFIIVDAAMNDYIRPALYQAEHSLLSVEQRDQETISGDVVGPVCETGDFIAKDVALKVAAGDYLAVTACGAYGFSMSSNYNSRLKPCEIMVDAAKSYVINPREELANLYLRESLLP